MYYQIIHGHIPGFIPEFKKGNLPVGIFPDLSNIVLVEEEVIELYSVDNLRYHYGGIITKIYEELIPWEQQSIWKDEIERRDNSAK